MRYINIIIDICERGPKIIKSILTNHIYDVPEYQPDLFALSSILTERIRSLKLDPSVVKNKILAILKERYEYINHNIFETLALYNYLRFNAALYSQNTRNLKSDSDTDIWLESSDE